MTDPFLAATAPDSPHYLRALTDMADRRAVVTQDAIYTDNGIKLVEKGARIDSRLYDRLVQHKLREHGRELFAWIEGGAHLYVCGDASRMARDVEAALLDVIASHGASLHD